MSKEKGLPPRGTGKPPEIFVPFIEIPDQNNGELAARYQRIEDDVRDLAGKILTIIDASVSNEIQNKAIKDMIKCEIRVFLGNYQRICWPTQGHSLSAII